MEFTSDVMVSNLSIAIPTTTPVLPSLVQDAADVLCMPMLGGSSTGTAMALGGSANNCLDS